MLKKGFLIGAMAVATLMGGMRSVAMAEMSDQEMRLLALEEKQNANAELLEIMKRFTWKGDLRLRYQGETREQPNNVESDRDRYRLRFRVGADIHMLKDLDIGFRLNTAGLAERDSGNQTFDGGFTHRAFDLDQAFFRYTPSVAGWNTTWQGGKFDPPFMRSEVVFDSDITVEGISEQFSKKFGNTQLDANFGQFVYDEINSGDGSDDIFILGYQGVVTQKTDLGKFKFAVAYYDVVNAEDPLTTFSSSTGFNTNSEIKMLDFMAEWSEKVMGQELKVFGEYEQNVGKIDSADRTSGDLNSAWQVGAKYGKSGKKFGDYDLKVIYRVVQANSVLDTISDSDFHGSNSNGRGFEAGGSLGLAKGVQLAITYFNTQEERGNKDEREILQTDLKFKF